MLDYHLGNYLPVHNHGHVALIDVMGDDYAVTHAARISYDWRGRSTERGLIRYLLRHRHTTPFEMAVLKFEVKMPIFVARQWIRHRTASINEISARYTQLPEEMFIPEVFSVQSADNKQGRGDEGQGDFTEDVKAVHANTYHLYEDMLEAGVARELARGILPLNIYTKFIWKMDLHNLMHFLDLRLNPHAQQEIRDYAEVIEKLVALRFPLCYEAFVDYIKKGYTCSRMEVEVLRELVSYYTDSEEPTDSLCRLSGMSKREIEDFKRTFLNG
jgi:thymidylate synthase (FAD)